MSKEEFLESARRGKLAPFGGSFTEELDSVQRGDKLWAVFAERGDELDYDYGALIVRDMPDAGRMAVLTLLPLSISELKNANLLPNKLETYL